MDRRGGYDEYYLLLSQDHPELSLTEATAITMRSRATISYSEPGLVILRALRGVEESLPRLSFVREFGLVIRRVGFRDGAAQVYREISMTAGTILDRCCGKISLRIYNLGRRRAELDYDTIARHMRGEIFSPRSKASLKAAVGSQCSLTIIIGNILVIAMPIARRAGRGRGGAVSYMKDTEISFLAGVASSFRGPVRTVYDPFGGYGKILEEFCRYHGPLFVLGSDIDARKAIYMKRSLRGSEGPCIFDVMVADALNPPIRPGGIELVVSDLPYGRRSRSIGDDHLEIPLRFLYKVNEILKNGSSLMISISLDQLRHLREHLLKEKSYKILSISSQYVHGSLTRIYIIIHTAGGSIDKKPWEDQDIRLSNAV